MEKQNQILALDLLCLYIGVEHYNECDEIGRVLESKSIETYFLQRSLSSSNYSRSFLVNIETGDEMQIDQDGVCIDCDSEYREILDVTGLHSFKESVEKLIESTKDFVVDMPNGKASLEYFITVRDHMIEAEKNGTPAYIEVHEMNNIMDAIGNIYTLSFGNPLTHESKIRCLYNFRRNVGHNDNE